MAKPSLFFSLLTLFKQNYSSSLHRNAFFLMVGSFLSQFIGFCSLIIAARFYPAEAIGLGSAAISAASLLAMFSDLGMQIAVTRYLVSYGKKGNELLNSIITLNQLITLIISIVFLAGVGLWSPALRPIQQSPIFFMFFLIFACFAALQPFIYNAFLARRQSQYIVISALIISGIKLGLIVWFSRMLNNGLGFFMTASLSILIGLLVTIFYFLPKVQREYRISFKLDIELIKGITKYALGNYISRLLIYFTPTLLPLIVINELGARETAYLYVGWSIGSILQTIPSAAFNSLFAEASNAESTLRTNIAKSLKLMFILLIPAIILIFLLAGYLLNIFGREYSDSAIWLLRLITLSVIPWGINYCYINIARIGNDMRGVIKLTALSSALSLILSYFLMIKMGILGIGIGYLCGQSISAIIVAIILWRRFNKNKTIESIV